MQLNLRNYCLTHRSMLERLPTRFMWAASMNQHELNIELSFARCRQDGECNLTLLLIFPSAARPHEIYHALFEGLEQSTETAHRVYASSGICNSRTNTCALSRLKRTVALNPICPFRHKIPKWAREQEKLHGWS